jgi:hypothetical protein
MIIKETYQLTASNTDILAAPSRLAALPGSGIMTIECSATECNATNNGTLTLQMPDGELPFENLLVPANGYSLLDSVVHDETALQMQIEVDQGGHVSLAYTETGTVVLFYITVSLEF